MSDVADEPTIVTRCPSCGHQSLFIGSGGHLTCGWSECRNPSVGHVIDQLKAEAAELAAVTALLVQAVRLPGIAGRLRTDVEKP